MDVYILEGIRGLNENVVSDIFLDPIAQDMIINECSGTLKLLDNWNLMIEVAYKPGVTDQVGLTAQEALRHYFDHHLEDTSCVQTATKYFFETAPLSEENIKTLLSSLYNNLIQTTSYIKKENWLKGKRFPALYPNKVGKSKTDVSYVKIQGLNDSELIELSQNRLLALSLPELKSVQEYFRKKSVQELRKTRGIGDGATDVELEMIAQTWSEHCKHKIFNATIEYQEAGKTAIIKSIFKTYIKNTTDEISRRKTYLKSVFHDNSGVIEFDKDTSVCFKVETHNSPSALDPYGGAITGIVGVNRDIMGTGKGAKPIFNTNVLCFGRIETRTEDMPKGILHPRQIMSGVHKGIIDGGNQSGIPTVAGAFLFDESYTGKPLVYCGTGGILPSKIEGEESWIKHIDPGDLAVMAGGRIGKDGIHGATFSSLALDETSPTSAVQIGDPITQKKMLDFLLEARDSGLYKGITDNGAGGLSSSLGEMAQSSGGVKIELDKCPLKYEGLSPWEILVSESQERMSLAVAKEKIDAFMNLAKKRDVEVTVVGRFTDTGLIEVYYNNKAVGLIHLDFLHDGLPVMEVKAEWEEKKRPEFTYDSQTDVKEDFFNLLKEPNIASKEDLVRQYDHEVQAYSIVKPFVGAKADGPSDGAVIKPVYDSHRGLTVTHGICPRYGDIDTYHMAFCAVDEAYRAHIALGGDPDSASALDNFCWPDPLESEKNPDAKYKMAQLVRACKGLHEACLTYGLPLISGKDSMKNDAYAGSRKISIRPTLLVSLMGIIKDVRLAMTSDFKEPDEIIYILGESRGEMGGTSYERLKGKSYGNCPKVNTPEAVLLYRTLHKAITAGLISSCHDLSDGGLAIALAEASLAGRVGVEVSLDALPWEKSETIDPVKLLFCETPSRFIVSVKKSREKDFIKVMGECDFASIGITKAENIFSIRFNQTSLINTELNKIEKYFKGQF
ncbi:MAG: phosphoribosylformylglycinamidine synthase subunit PurL [Spirochaetales bacterium]|nr:phosphoribosylformylglycinamidine synthase subunit PurL [Spirochaetales bacterium]